MKSFLNIIAGMPGFTSQHSCARDSLRRHYIRGLLEMLQANGRALTTINTELLLLSTHP